MKPTIVIVGAGMAGARAALSLRKEGFEGRVVLIGDEPHEPYERPPLSKAYLRGEQDAPAIRITPKGSGWADIGVEVRTGRRVTRILPAESTVETADGNARALRPAAARHGLGTTEAGGAWRASSTACSSCAPSTTPIASARLSLRGAPMAVIGGGWIGAEVAACCRQLGAEVTLLTGSKGLLERQLGARSRPSTRSCIAAEA